MHRPHTCYGVEMAASFATATSLQDLPGIVHAFSGELRTPADEDELAAAMTLVDVPRARLRQVHGADVVRAEDSLDSLVPGDALITDQPGVALTIRTADCVPILLVDPDAPVLAAVHAGWRGMRARIVTRTLAAMVAAGGVPERIRAAIGPAVQGTCYRVGPEVHSAFRATFPDAESLFSGDRLDLVRAARAELARAGVRADATSTIDRCTHCEPDLASHRRQGRERGNNLALLALVP